MRRGALGVAAILLCAVVGPARAQDSIVCPAGTQRGTAQRATGSEQWCERPGTNPRILHGPFASWQPAGAIQVRGEYRDGKPSGTWKSWHPGGAQSGEVTFVDGKPTGMLLGWYPNGQASFVGGFRDGTAIGMMEIFDPASSAAAAPGTTPTGPSTRNPRRRPRSRRARSSPRSSSIWRSWPRASCADATPRPGGRRLPRVGDAPHGDQARGVGARVTSWLSKWYHSWYEIYH